VRAVVDGVPARIRVSGGYPFMQSVEMNVSVKQSAEFPIYLRIPFWARQSMIYLPDGEIMQVRAGESTCIRRRFGAVIVKNDSIISTGYNGAPRGRANCNELGSCYRDTLGIPRGERYELCRSVHAEANAIIAAPREQMLGATVYMCCTSPEDGSIMSGTTSCMMCKRLIINAGIERLVVRDDAENFRVINVSEWIEDDDSLGGKMGY
jgi:dCMP deaminase